MRQNHEDVEMGRFLSLVLRHNPGAAFTQLDANGWADVNLLIQGVRKSGRQLTMEDLERIVRENSKNRYSFNEDHTRIRANQGHSVAVDLGFVPVIPPLVLYHGTADHFIKEITSKGITSQSRQYVHLSQDRQTANQVGARHGVPVILEIDAKAMHQDGYSFYQSENQVWLCEFVPPQYIRLPIMS